MKYIGVFLSVVGFVVTLLNLPLRTAQKDHLEELAELEVELAKSVERLQELAPGGGQTVFPEVAVQIENRANKFLVLNRAGDWQIEFYPSWGMDVAFALAGAAMVVFGVGKLTGRASDGGAKFGGVIISCFGIAVFIGSFPVILLMPHNLGMVREGNERGLFEDIEKSRTYISALEEIEREQKSNFLVELAQIENLSERLIAAYKQRRTSRYYRTFGVGLASVGVLLLVSAKCLCAFRTPSEPV